MYASPELWPAASFSMVSNVKLRSALIGTNSAKSASRTTWNRDQQTFFPGLPYESFSLRHQRQFGIWVGVSTVWTSQILEKAQEIKAGSLQTDDNQSYRLYTPLGNSRSENQSSVVREGFSIVGGCFELHWTTGLVFLKSLTWSWGLSLQ